MKNSPVNKTKKEFIDCISGLNTPKKIGAYILENFVFRDKEGGPNVRNPYGFWKIKKGNCVDFSEFGAFVADYHGYKVYQMGISFKKTSRKHLITIYVEDNGLSFTSNQIYIDNAGHYFKNFSHILQFMNVKKDSECQLKIDTEKCIIKCYQDRIIKWSGSNYIN